MSWFSQALGGIGNAAKGVGHAAGQVLSNPIVDAGLSLGGQALGIPAPLTDATLQGLGGVLKPGGNIGGALKGAALGAGEGLAAGGLGSALGVGAGASNPLMNLPGAQGIGGVFSGLGGAVHGLPGVAGIQQLLSGAGNKAASLWNNTTPINRGSMTGASAATGGMPADGGLPNGGTPSASAGGLAGLLSGIPGVAGIEQLLGGAGGGIGGALGGLGKFLGGNGGLNALGAAQGVNTALLQQQANKYATNAMGQQQAAYNQLAPLRSGGLQGMQSALASNPFSGTALPARAPGALPVGGQLPSALPVSQLV